MKYSHKEFYRVTLVAFVWGGVCINIYMSFVGNAFSFLMDQNFFQKFMYMFGSLGDLRSLMFKIYTFFQDIIFMFMVFIPLLYFFSKMFKKLMPFSLVAFLGGALITDFLLYLYLSKVIDFMPVTPLFSHSSIFKTGFFAYLQNITVWGSVFLLSIIISNKLKNVCSSSTLHD